MHRSKGRPPALAVMLVVGCVGCAGWIGCGAPASKPVAAPAVERDTIPRSRFVAVDGGRLHYLDAGAGTTAIVLVHGWAGDHRVWRRQIESLAADHRVIAPDLPGHGESDAPAADYSMDLFADAIAAVLDDAGIARAVLVGHSNGVSAVRQFYRRHPERTTGLVLVDGSLRAMFDAQLAESFLDMFSGPDFRTQVEATIERMPLQGLEQERKAEILAIALEQPQGAVLGMIRAATDPAIFEADLIEVPLLVILAAQPAWDGEYEAFVRGLAPQVDYETLPETNHFIMVHRPDEFDGLLGTFLGTLDPAL